MIRPDETPEPSSQQPPAPGGQPGPPGAAGSATPPGEGGWSYADAGVDIAAGERAVDMMRAKVRAASRPEVVGEFGGFAGLFDLDIGRYRRPVLAAATDGVGTKVAIAQAMNTHHTVGIDLVAMVVDDLVTCGAEPLFLLDYIACGKVSPERITEIVDGIAEGCRQAGCALLGGETAEHPGLMEADAYDLAATGVGVVEANRVLGAERVRAGDAVLGLFSSGLHSNGYSLVRQVLREGRLRLDAQFDELDEERTLGEVLLQPTRIYVQDCLALLHDVDVHAFAHITGGGLATNLARVLPEPVHLAVDRGTWVPAPVFRLVQERGRVDDAEMERTFNMGIGMAAVVAGRDVERALALLMGRRVTAAVLGEVRAGAGGVRLVGRHAA